MNTLADLKGWVTGPNVKKLLIHVFSKDVSSLSDGIEKIKALPTSMTKAAIETKSYIEAMRCAKDANPKWTDEDIAKMLLDGIEARKKAKVTANG